MGIIFLRVRRAFGWRGIVALVGAVGIVIALLTRTVPATDTQAWVVIVLPLGALVMLSSRMGGYQAPQAVRSDQEVLPPLLASGQEFCLVLRPFGQDGETFLRGYRMTRRKRRRTDLAAGYSHLLTIEQVIARAARQALGLDTYALVDQKRELAPPGPVYLRAPNQRWQEAVLALIQHAHSIVLWLAPGQDMRASFHWEIEQIVQAGRQLQTVVMLPPPGQDGDAYRQAVSQATVLLAALESATGKVTDADPARIRHYQAALGDSTLMATFVPPAGGNGPLNLRRWRTRGGRTWLRAPKYPSAFTYEQGLELLMSGPDAELAGRPNR